MYQKIITTINWVLCAIRDFVFSIWSMHQKIVTTIITTINGVLCAIRDFVFSIWPILKKWYTGTALRRAAARGDTETVKALIRAIGGVNKVDEYGTTALMEAAARGHTETVKVLIEAKADVNKVDMDGGTALMDAAARGHSETVKVLIKAKADVNKVNRNGYTALMKAAARGHIETVKVLIKAKADVNKVLEYGGTALMHAAWRGYSEIVELLIKAKADVNEVDNKGKTALMYAAEKGHTEIVKALIEAGADVNKVTEYGYTALTIAAEKGHTEIVKALIEAGADVNKVTEYDYTALTIAAEEGHTEIVKDLIEAGANVNQVNRYGYTALVIATSRGDGELIAAIENFKTAYPTIIAIQENRMSILGITKKNAQEKTEAGYTTLMAACASDDIALTKKLLEYEADIYAQDAYGRTALSCARSTTMVMDFIGSNSLDIKRALGGVDGGYLVLRRAVEENNKELIQLILEAVPEIVGHDNSLLSLSDDITVIRLLLHYGIRPPSNIVLQPHIQQEVMGYHMHHILANTPWSYEQMLTMTVGDVKAWMGDYADMLPQASDHVYIIDQETMEKIRVCKDDTIKATEFLETDDHLLYTVYCAKVVREMKERKMSLDTKTLVNLMESNMYFKSGYIDQALDRLLKTPEVIDVHAASYRIKLEELLQPLLMIPDESSHDERLLEFLRRFMQDHITTAPEKSKDYQILLALTDNITPGTSDDLNKSIKEQIAEVQAFRQSKAGVEGVFSDRWVKWVENWIMNQKHAAPFHSSIFSIFKKTDTASLDKEKDKKVSLDCRVASFTF